MPESEWISTGGSYPRSLPRLAFPLEGAMPDLYVPHSTMLQTANGVQTHAYLWCYLERKVYGKRYWFNPASLSATRVNDMPRAIERLSKRFSFDNARPWSVSLELANGMSRLLNWLDGPIHQGRFESVLSNPDLALDALKKHHSYLRQRMQANQTENRISVAVASTRDFAAIKMMSAIHDREYRNEIETIPFIHGDGVKTPKAEDVAAFMACAQGVFDSVVRIVLDSAQDDNGDFPLGVLRWQLEGQERAVPVAGNTHIERIMELGCMAYAALCLGDSGANLAPIQSYEEPEDLQEQLKNPEKLNLRHKVIKFRAEGKEVPLHLTATTVTRMHSYLRLREALRLKLGSPEIRPMFIQCIYPLTRHSRPSGISPLLQNFTAALRSRFSSVGIKLPQVTMQQLRAHKAGKVAKEHNPKVAADMMGHSISTAIRRYHKITEVDARSEMAPFLASLTSVVLTRSEADATSSRPATPITSIPAGGCENHGHPEAPAENPLVEPDCKKTEGCFFCNKFRVHADEADCIKLMSCRSVLERLAPRLGDSGSAELIYAVVIDRIGALLNDIKRINPEAHERARVTVLKEGKLSRYWVSKLQQLHLLGLIAPSSAPA